VSPKPRPYEGGAPRFASLGWEDATTETCTSLRQAHVRLPNDELSLVVTQDRDGTYTIYDYFASVTDDDPFARAGLDALDVECFLITAYPER
jgi:hypothetical protein